MRMTGWTGMGRLARDRRRLAPGQYRSFKKARAFARGLGLKFATEWLDYCQSGKRPGDIPSNPDKAYTDAGWVCIRRLAWDGRNRRKIAPISTIQKSALVRAQP